jgi:two-component system phosphate regulon sensor histidine kinase PhoR
VKKRLFVYTILVTFSGLLVFFAVSINLAYTNNLNIAKNSVIEITQIAANLYTEDADLSEFVRGGDDTRITVISAEGEVLADSRPLDIGAIDNHLNRLEIEAASNGVPTAFVRHSDSLGIDFIYYALQVVSGDSHVFVRAAIPVAEINTYLFRSLPLLVCILLMVAFLCFVIIHRITTRVLVPFNSIEGKLRSLSNGDYTLTPIKSGYEEIDRIAREIDDVALMIQSGITDLNNEKIKREDFFANASHELKTPLTAIKGFNELTALKNKDESIDKYVAAITRETDRMLTLISDMLKLSALENTEKDETAINPVIVPLTAIITDVRDTMSTIIDEKEITFKVVGSGAVKAEPNHVYDIVKNLVENAARYNNQGGEVSVTVNTTAKSVRLTVSDNGIGIPPKEQARIFERFYRVEKSRSQLGGGTGLGLAIVKHVCALYDWKLSLKSKIGEGTEITVEF